MQPAKLQRAMLSADSPLPPFTRKLAGFFPLASNEMPLLRELQSGSRPFRRGQEIIIEGKSYRTLFIIIDGIAVRYRILRDGRRQVLNVVLPGDIAGFPGCLFDAALYSIKALTEIRASPLSFARLMDLFHTRPSLAAKLFVSLSCDTAIYAEHLIAVGRRNALERVAHFLLELLMRLQAIELADERSFRLPLTQELIADALGLSIPYVNQVLRRLRDDDLICVTDKVIVIRDVEALSAMVDFERAYLRPVSMIDLLDQAA